MLNLRPRARRTRIASHTCVTFMGTSGAITTSPPPASAEQMAIQPTLRPITSTTITRSCASAVECTASMACTTVPSAVSKPNE